MKELVALQFEIENADIDCYITSGNKPMIYIGTADKSYTVKATYSWIDKEGKTQKVEGQGIVASVKPAVWELGAHQGKARMKKRKGKEERKKYSSERTNRAPNKTKPTCSGFPLPLFAVKVFLSNYKTKYRSDNSWCKTLAAKEPREIYT